MTSNNLVDEAYIKLQREVLYAQGQSWFLNIHGWNDRNQTTPICEWHGITCDDQQTNVIGIDLVGYNIAGPISPSLGLLSSLLHINLSKNYLSGKIPDEIGSLPYLATFRVNHNRLSGEIPRFVSSKLTEVNVSHNVLQGIEYFCDGRIDDKRDGDIKLTTLEILDASYNSLVGNIPEAFETLTHLHQIDLSFNKLYGTIPMGIGNMKDLKSLQLNDNRLIGTIPLSLTRGELSLIDLNLSNNDLSGTIPTGFSNIRYLKNLQITGNKLTGAVPLPLCHLSLNENLFDENDTISESGLRDGCNSIACPINSASLTGVYPCVACGDQGYDWYVGHVGKCLHLNEKILLDKIYDQTNGPMWKEGTGWTLSHVDKCAYSGVECSTSGHVTAINLTDHGLSGQIPPEFGMFRYLRSIDLSDNELTGYLPSEFRFPPIEFLDVSGNKLDGVVPPMLCLAGDINGNGYQNDFNCDIISCPSGTWSPIGRATTAEFHNGKRIREHSCKPCKKTHTFLGSRQCVGAFSLDSLQNSDSGWIQIGSREFGAILAFPLIGACAMVACATLFILRRNKQFMTEPPQQTAGKRNLMPRRVSLRNSASTQFDSTRGSTHSVEDERFLRDSLRNSIHSIGRRFSFHSNRSGDEGNDSGAKRSSREDWDYDTDHEDDEDESHDVLAKNFGSSRSFKEVENVQHPLHLSESTESLPAFEDRRIQKRSKDEGADESSYRSGSQTSSKSKGSKNTRASKKAEKWLDVAHPL